MSFELRAEKSLPKNVRRIAKKQMEAALEELEGGHKDSRDEVVHEARKSLKKIRAVLRLVRPVIGEKSYRRENNWFRDAARPLTEVRDARILLETLDKLAEHFHEHIAGRSLADVRKTLQDNLRSVRKRVLDEQNAFVVEGETIRKARERVKSWANVPDKWRSIGKGLECIYRRARSAFKAAGADPTVEKLHEWRKEAKYLRYQLEILRPLWPQRIEELANEADRLGELLGDDHDLAIFRQILIDGPEPFGDEGDREILLELIDRRRAELEQEALLLGDRFFRERPKEFVRQLKGYWKTWHGRARPKPPEEFRLAPAV